MASHAQLASLQPEENYAHFIDRGVRPNGRALAAARRLAVSARPLEHGDDRGHGRGNTRVAGSALASVGGTRVLGTARLQIGTPDLEAPRDGSLDVTISLAPAFFGTVTAGGQSTSPAEARMRCASHVAACAANVRAVLLAAGVVDLTDLCIEEEAAAWAVTLELVCLNDDGSLFDVALAAAMATLRCVRLPATVPDTTRPDSGLLRVLRQPLEEQRPLPLRNAVASLTCAVWHRCGGGHRVLLCADSDTESDAEDGGAAAAVGSGGEDAPSKKQKRPKNELAIADPDKAEEAILQTAGISVVHGASGGIHGIYSRAPFTNPITLFGVMALTKVAAKDRLGIIDEATPDLSATPPPVLPAAPAITEAATQKDIGGSSGGLVAALEAAVGMQEPGGC